jgi:alkanesulfonate monooxygenase
MTHDQALEVYSYLSPTENGGTYGHLRGSVDGVAGLDRVLIGYHSFGPDNLVLGTASLAHSPDLNVLIAHRPGVVQPTVTARMVATMSSLSGGRNDLHIVTGGAPGDQYREGDYLGHDDRYRRASEYVDVLRACWEATEPFSHEGEFYKFEDVRPNEMQVAKPVRIHMGGASPAALEFGASKADVYMLWGEPFDDVRSRIEQIEKTAAGYGRPRPRISLSLRLYIAATDDEAWEIAYQDPAYQKWLAKGAEVTSREHSQDAGRNRQLEVARRSERHDDCLWMGVVAALNGLGNAAALVGTEDRIMETLRRYREMGVDTFLISGELGHWRPSLTPTVHRMKREL